MRTPPVRLVSLLLVGVLIALALVVRPYSGSTPVGAQESTDTPAATIGRTAPDTRAATLSIASGEIGAHIAQIEGARRGLGSTDEKTKLDEVRGYIHTQLEGFGLSVQEDPVTRGGETFPNVIGTLLGTVCPDTSFVVGAHYDSVSGTPGADDNASGVAGMLEIARALSSQSFQPSIEFVGFPFEEDGLAGSRQMASQADAAGKDIIGMFSLEMIGYTCDVPGCQTYPPGTSGPDVGTFIAVVGNTASALLLQTFTEASAAAVPGLLVEPLEVPGNGETFPDTRRSDHAPFWDHGYRALLITDTANFRNPYYHGASDTLGTLDLNFAADVASAALATVVESVTADYDNNGIADACEGDAVGGIAELPHLAATPLETSDSSRRNLGSLATIAAAATAGALLATGVAWYARRRWIR